MKTDVVTMRHSHNKNKSVLWGGYFTVGILIYAWDNRIKLVYWVGFLIRVLGLLSEACWRDGWMSTGMPREVRILRIGRDGVGTLCTICTTLKRVACTMSYLLNLKALYLGKSWVGYLWWEARRRDGRKWQGLDCVGKFSRGKGGGAGTLCTTGTTKSSAILTSGGCGIYKNNSVYWVGLFISVLGFLLEAVWRFGGKCMGMPREERIQGNTGDGVGTLCTMCTTVKRETYIVFCSHILTAFILGRDWVGFLWWDDNRRAGRMWQGHVCVGECSREEGVWFGTLSTTGTTKMSDCMVGWFIMYIYSLLVGDVGHTKGWDRERMLSMVVIQGIYAPLKLSWLSLDYLFCCLTRFEAQWCLCFNKITVICGIICSLTSHQPHLAAGLVSAWWSVAYRRKTRLVYSHNWGDIRSEGKYDFLTTFQHSYCIFLNFLANHTCRSLNCVQQIFVLTFICFKFESCWVGGYHELGWDRLLDADNGKQDLMGWDKTMLPHQQPSPLIMLHGQEMLMQDKVYRSRTWAHAGWVQTVPQAGCNICTDNMDTRTECSLNNTSTTAILSQYKTVRMIKLVSGHRSKFGTAAAWHRTDLQDGSSICKQCTHTRTNRRPISTSCTATFAQYQPVRMTTMIKSAGMKAGLQTRYREGIKQHLNILAYWNNEYHLCRTCNQSGTSNNKTAVVHSRKWGKFILGWGLVGLMCYGLVRPYFRWKLTKITACNHWPYRASCPIYYGIQEKDGHTQDPAITRGNANQSSGITSRFNHGTVITNRFIIGYGGGTRMAVSTWACNGQ